MRILPLRHPTLAMADRSGPVESTHVSEFWRLLSLLSIAARQPHLPATAFRRHDPGPRGNPSQPVDAQLRVASRGPRRRVCVRLGRALLLREDPARDVHLPLVQLPWRLGDVARYADGTDQALMNHYSFTALLYSEL